LANRRGQRHDRGRPRLPPAVLRFRNHFGELVAPQNLCATVVGAGQIGSTMTHAPTTESAAPVSRGLHASVPSVVRSPVACGGGRLAWRSTLKHSNRFKSARFASVMTRGTIILVAHRVANLSPLSGLTPLLSHSVRAVTQSSTARTAPTRRRLPSGGAGGGAAAADGTSGNPKLR
jgi:hypothetical protein